MQDSTTKPVTKLEDIAPDSTYRLMEASYFLQRMVETYHIPDAFQFNLNATIQSIRNITFVLQSELSTNTHFLNWYKIKQEEMRSNPLLRKFIDARNLIVKKSSLKTSSRASIGLFKYDRIKLWTQSTVCPYTDSRYLLKMAQSHFYGLFIDEEHSAIGEQLGVKREWIASDFGEDELVTLCNTAIDYFGVLFTELATLLDSEFKWFPGKVHKLNRVQILLESDVDPTLPKKWGWE